MSEALKPCPFCGGDDIRPAGSAPHHYHRCGGCGCEGPVFFSTPDAAAQAWNRRAPPTLAEAARVLLHDIHATWNAFGNAGITNAAKLDAALRTIAGEEG